jgi:hypothetical protein
MRSSIWALVFAVALFGQGGSNAIAQSRTDQSREEGHTQFDEHDRQVANDWYGQHQSRPPAGLRSRDRLSPDQESRLQPGRPLGRDLQKHVHSVPSDLGHRLPPAPPNHRYVAIGGHVGLVDKKGQVLRDVIHLHN